VQELPKNNSQPGFLGPQIGVSYPERIGGDALTSRLIHLCLFASFLVCAASPARADVIYSNLGLFCNPITLQSCSWEGDNGDPILGATYNPGDEVAYSASFTPAFTGYLTEVQLPLEAVNYGPGYNQMTVEFLADSNDSPGNAVLESWSVTAPNSSGDYPLTELTGNGTVLLSAGTQYWLAVLPSLPATVGGGDRIPGRTPATRSSRFTMTPTTRVG
jgi:hypothetical protein